MGRLILYLCLCPWFYTPHVKATALESGSKNKDIMHSEKKGEKKKQTKQKEDGWVSVSLQYRFKNTIRGEDHEVSKGVSNVYPSIHPTIHSMFNTHSSSNGSICPYIISNNRHNNLCIHQSTHPSTYYPSTLLSMWKSIHPPINLQCQPFLNLSTILWMDSSFHGSIHPPIHESILSPFHQSVHLSIYPETHPNIHQSVHNPYTH